MKLCEEVTAMMSDALDGRLDDDAWQQLQEHIDTCQSCWQTWAAFRNVDTLLRSTPMAIPPPGFAQRATQAAVAAQRRRTWLISLLALAGGGIVVAFLMSIATLAETGMLYYLLTLPAVFIEAPGLLETFLSVLLTAGEAIFVLLQAVQRMLLGPLFWPAAIAFGLSWVLLLLAGVLGRQLMWRRSMQHR